MVTRRAFLQTAAGSPLAAAQSVHGGRLLLGFDAYTLRDLKWKAIELIDFAAKQRLDAIQLDLNYFASREAAYVAQVREAAKRAQIRVDGSIGCICRSSSGWRPENRDPVEYLRTGLRIFHDLGARCMRVFMGANGERIGLEKHIENTISALRAVRSQALDLNVKIAVENHGDTQAWEMRDLIEAAGKDFVGANLDS